MCLAILQANEIPNANVFICMDEDVAYVGSVNNKSKVWTIHSPGSKWVQCDCPITCKRMICKHTMKVFKMLNLDIKDGVITKKTSMFHGIDYCTSMSQCYSNFFCDASLAGHTTQPAFLVDDVFKQHVVDLDVERIGDTIDTYLASVIQSQDMPEVFACMSLADMSNNSELPHEESTCAIPCLQSTVHTVQTTLTKNVEDYPMLHDYLFVDLKHIREKQKELIACGIAMLHIALTTLSFQERGSDNSFKRHRGFLEKVLPKEKKMYFLILLSTYKHVLLPIASNYDSCIIPQLILMMVCCIKVFPHLCFVRAIMFIKKTKPHTQMFVIVMYHVSFEVLCPLSRLLCPLPREWMSFFMSCNYTTLTISCFSLYSQGVRPLSKWDDLQHHFNTNDPMYTIFLLMHQSNVLNPKLVNGHMHGLSNWTILQRQHY